MNNQTNSQNFQTQHQNTQKLIQSQNIDILKLNTNQLKLTQLIEPQLFTYIENIKTKVHQHSYVKIENDKFKFYSDDDQTEQLFEYPYITSAGVYNLTLQKPTQFQPKYKIFSTYVVKQQQQIIQNKKQLLNKSSYINMSLQIKKHSVSPSAQLIKQYQKYIYSIAQNIKLTPQKHEDQYNEIEQKVQQFVPNKKIEQMLQTQQFDDSYLSDLSLLPSTNRNQQITQYLKDCLSFATQCVKSQYSQIIINCPVYIPELITMLVTNIIPLIKQDKVQQDIPKVLIETDNSDISVTIQQKLLQQHSAGINLTTQSGTRTNVTNDKHYYEKYHFSLADLQPLFFKEQNDDQTVETFTNMINIKFVQQIKENSDITIRLVTRQNQQFLPPLQHCKNQFQIYVISVRNCNQNILGQILFNTNLTVQKANMLTHYFKSIQIVPSQQVYQLKNQFYKTIQTDFSADTIQSLAMIHPEYSIYQSPKKFVEQIIEQLQQKQSNEQELMPHADVAKCLSNQIKNNNIDFIKQCKDELILYDKRNTYPQLVNINHAIQQQIEDRRNEYENIQEKFFNQNEKIDKNSSIQFLQVQQINQYQYLSVQQSSFDQTDFYYFINQKKKQELNNQQKEKQKIQQLYLQKTRHGKILFKFQQIQKQSDEIEDYYNRIKQKQMEQIQKSSDSLRSLIDYIDQMKYFQKYYQYSINTHRIQPQYYEIVPWQPQEKINILDKMFIQLTKQFGEQTNQKIVIITSSKTQKHYLKLLIKQYNLNNWYVTQTDQIAKFESMDIKILLPETNISSGGQVYQLEIRQQSNQLIDIVKRSIQETNNSIINSDIQNSKIYPCFYKFIQNILENVQIIDKSQYKIIKQQEIIRNYQSNIIKQKQIKNQQFLKKNLKYILPIEQLASKSFMYRCRDQNNKCQYIPLCINFINPLSNNFMPVCQRYNGFLSQTLKIQAQINKKITEPFQKIKLTNKFTEKRFQVSNFLFNSQIFDKDKYSISLIILFQRYGQQLVQSNNFPSDILQNQQEVIQDGTYRREEKKVEKLESPVILQNINVVNKQIAQYKKQGGTYFNGTLKTMALFYLEQRKQLQQQCDVEKECNKVVCTERWHSEQKQQKNQPLDLNSVFYDEFSIK